MFGTGYGTGTPLDLRFQLFGIPVTVTPFFWVLAGLLGWGTIQKGPEHLIAWILAVFLSLLVHEFGHAFTAQWYGHEPSVLLYHFGGLAFYGSGESPGRSFFISAAGPAVQFALGAFLLFLPPVLFRWGILLPLPTQGTPFSTFLSSLAVVSIFWALFNLLPILPMDGGRMLESALTYFNFRRASEWTLKVGLLFAVPLAVLALLNQQMYLGMLFAFMAIENWRSLQGLQHGPW